MPSNRSAFWSTFSFLVAALQCGAPPLVFSAAANPERLVATMQRKLQRASAALAKFDPAKNNVVHSEGTGVYKCAHPGGQNGSRSIEIRNRWASPAQSKQILAEGLCIAIRIAEHYW